jgi:hypothetical protein
MPRNDGRRKTNSPLGELRDTAFQARHLGLKLADALFQGGFGRTAGVVPGGRAVEADPDLIAALPLP